MDPQLNLVTIQSILHFTESAFILLRIIVRAKITQTNDLGERKIISIVMMTGTGHSS